MQITRGGICELRRNSTRSLPIALTVRAVRLKRAKLVCYACPIGPLMLVHAETKVPDGLYELLFARARSKCYTFGRFFDFLKWLASFCSHEFRTRVSEHRVYANRHSPWSSCPCILRFIAYRMRSDVLVGAVREVQYQNWHRRKHVGPSASGFAFPHNSCCKSVARSGITCRRSPICSTRTRLPAAFESRRR